MVPSDYKQRGEELKMVNIDTRVEIHAQSSLVTKTCPYNSGHQILESKMTVHLIRTSEKQFG